MRRQEGEKVAGGLVDLPLGYVADLEQAGAGEIGVGKTGAGKIGLVDQRH
jgi:hypothetical protein